MIKRSEIPAVSGVYKGFVGDECVYVGSSLCLRSRLTNHPHRKLCDRWEWDLVPPAELIAAEQALLDQHKPRLNRDKRARRNIDELRNTKLVAVRVDRDIYEAFEHYVRASREKPGAVVQKAIWDLLKRRGYWPPRSE